MDIYASLNSKENLQPLVTSLLSLLFSQLNWARVRPDSGPSQIAPKKSKLVLKDLMKNDQSFNIRLMQLSVNTLFIIFFG